MSELLRLKLEGLPPSANQMYRTGRSGSRYKRPEVSEWQEETAGTIRKAWSREKPYAEPVEVYVRFTVGNNRRWDVDNRLKALLDCLELGGAIHDDSQIWGILALRVQGERSATELQMREYTVMRKKSQE